MLRLAANFVINAVREQLGRPSPYHPLYAVLYVTYRCNLSCSYCDDGVGNKYPDKPSPRELDTGRMRELLGVIRTFADCLNLCGGEPLVRKDLEDLVDETRRRRFHTVILSTNGVGLEKRTRLLGKIQYYSISLDTLDDRRSGPLWGGADGTVRRVMDTVEWIAGLRRRYGHEVVVNGVITPGNLSDIHAVIDWALARNVFFSASPYFTGRFPVAGLYDNREYQRLIDRLIRLRAKGHRIIGTSAFLRTVRDFSAPYDCRPMQTLVNIRPDGRIYYPCNRFDQPAGDLLVHRALRAAVDEGIARNGRVDACDGYCPTLRYMNGTLQIQDPTILLEEIAVVSRRGARELYGRLRERARSLLA